MSNSAVSTVTVWSEDPAALVAVREHAAAASTRGHHRLATLFGGVGERPFSLEAVVPAGMELDAWDRERAFALWGTSLPEKESTVEEVAEDRVVYELVTATPSPRRRSAR